MTAIALISLCVVGYWILAYREARLGWWVALTLGAVLLFFFLRPPLPLPILVTIVTLALFYVVIWGLAPVRRHLISGPLLHQFRRVLPSLSSTEQQALEAGTVGWDGELFSGRPNWNQLLETAPVNLSTEEEAFLAGPVEELCHMLDDWQITHYDQDLPPEVWDFIKQKLFFGLIIPKRYGGLEFSAYAHSQIVMKIASRSTTAAVTVMVPNSLGPGKLLLHYGTEEQKNILLPQLANGSEIPCFALTGPHAGSDAGSIPDTGVVCKDQWQGKEVLGVRLNWEKRYITLGPVATLIGLAFKLYDPDHLLGSDTERGITVALVRRDTPGVEIGARHIPLNIPFQNGPNSGKDVFIPLTQIIGGTEGIGNGWRMLVESLAEGRSISLPSLATSACKSATAYTGAYARVRHQFNLPIGRFEGVIEALARIVGYTYQTDAARCMTLAALDRGEKPSVISAIVKYHLTERYRRAINDAMDIQGGSGICLGPSNLIGHSYQSIPISITVEGANILTRSMIIFGQGAIRSHPWVLKEFSALANPDRAKALKEFDHALLGHAGFLIGNLARSLLLGLTRGYFSSVPRGAAGITRRYYQRLNWMCSAFSLSADVAMMTLGGMLKRKESLSARLGDVLSELYLSSAVLKRFHDEGSLDSDQPLVEWALHKSLYKIQEALRGLYRNFPLRPIGWLLRLLVFPSGMPFSEPTDKTSQAIAALALAPSTTRDRLISGIYLTEDLEEPVGRLEKALELSAKYEKTEKVLRNAVRRGTISPMSFLDQCRAALEQGLIDQQAHDALLLLENLRNEIIAVSAFDDWGKQHLLVEYQITNRDNAA